MDMVTMGAFEAKRKFVRLLERVECGEEILITRRGEEVARLVPVGTRPDREAAMAAFRRLRERATRAGLGRFEWAECRAYRDQGRP
jgi:prevent-host-death family protein